MRYTKRKFSSGGQMTCGEADGAPGKLGASYRFSVVHPHC